MLCGQIIQDQYPTYQWYTSSVGDLINSYQNSCQNYFPILEDTLYKGLLNYDQIKDHDHEERIEGLASPTLIAIQQNDHMLMALRLMAITKICAIAVIDKENQYVGMITQTSLLNALSTFNDIAHASGGLFVLQMNKINYSFSELSRLIESNDATIIQLNTYFDIKADVFFVTIRVSINDISAIIATLQRFDYHIVYSFGDELYENDLKRNYESLMNYLNI